MNELGVYKPEFYANEALIILYNALGMANAVHRGFDEERSRENKGQVINIRRPSVFTAQDAPSAAQDLDTETVQINLSFWKEVKFKVRDDELAFSEERIIADHIEPAAYALADFVDEKLALLYQDIPWESSFSKGSPPSSFVDVMTGGRQVLFDNGVPLKNSRMLYGMVDGYLENKFLSEAAFSQQQGAGDMGVATQASGMIGPKFGFNWFANQNTQEHTAGAITASAPKLDGGGDPVAKGTSQITVDDTSLTGTVKKGDTLVIDGSAQRYAITADASASGNAIVLNIAPALKVAYADNAAVTFSQANHTANMMWHRNAFGLAFGRLPDRLVREAAGANVFTAVDPQSALAVRGRIYYVGDDSELHVALDVLFGMTTLDHNLATRVRATA